MSRAKQLLDWYNLKAYSFPWRQDYNAYKIWISEIMLQQSQVNTVIPYYNKWMQQFPTIKHLSSATLDELLLLWQGLGYYNRVKNIFETVKIIDQNYNRKIPDNYKNLLSLKGIGDYTASAILAIGFNIKAIPIDGNIHRVISRLHELSATKNQLKIIKNYTEQYICNKNPRDSVQSLMDLGREICKPKNPNCLLCPLHLECLSYQHNTVNAYPVKQNRKPIPAYDVAVGLIKKKNKFLISKRLKNKFLGGLWELPGGKIKTGESPQECLEREIKEELNIRVEIHDKIGTVNHQYSHFKVSITLYECRYQSGKPIALESDEIRWITDNQKNQFAFPSATHKLFALIT